MFLPEGNGVASVIWEIRERSFINVEHPNVLSVSGEVEGFRIFIGFGGDKVTIPAVLFSEHVMTDIVFACLGDLGPFLEVVCLDGQPPAQAVEIGMLVAAGAGMWPEQVDDVWRCNGCCGG